MGPSCKNVLNKTLLRLQYHINSFHVSDLKSLISRTGVKFIDSVKRRQLKADKKQICSVLHARHAFKMTSWQYYCLFASCQYIWYMQKQLIFYFVKHKLYGKTKVSFFFSSCIAPLRSKSCYYYILGLTLLIVQANLQEKFERQVVLVQSSHTRLICLTQTLIYGLLSFIEDMLDPNILFVISSSKNPDICS